MDKVRRGQWRTDSTYSFLIDIKEEGRVIFRIFLQSSASNENIGYPDSIDISQKNIDLALLGAPNYTNSTNYPWGFLTKYKPIKVVFCHWENFFDPFEEASNKFVFGTNFKKFLPELGNFYDNKAMETCIFPEPGTKIYIKAGD